MTSPFSRFATIALLGSLASGSLIADELGYAQLGVGSSSYDGEESATAVSLSAAMFFNSWLGTELAFTNFGEVDEQPLPSNTDVTFKLKASTFSLSAVGKYNINDSMAFYGKAGIDVWEADVSFYDNSRRSDTDEGAEPFFAFGLVYRFGDQLAVAGEYQFHSFDVLENTIDIEQFMVGLRLVF